MSFLRAFVSCSRCISDRDIRCSDARCSSRGRHERGDYFMKLKSALVAAVTSLALVGAAAAPALTLPTRDQFTAFTQTKASQSGSCQALMIESNKLTSPPYATATRQNPSIQLAPSLADWQTEAETGIDCLTLVQREGASDAAQSVPRDWATQGCSAIKVQYQVVDKRCVGFGASPSASNGSVGVPPVAQAQPQCTLTGKVVDQRSGSPISGATVIVEGVADAMTPTTGFFRLSTDEKGIYRGVVPVGIYDASVYAHGYGGLQQRVGGPLSPYGRPTCSGADFALTVGQEGTIPTYDPGCIDPDTSTTANIVSSLNNNVGKIGGPSKRISALQKITHRDGDNKGTCRATLVFASGDTQTGFLVEDLINGVPSWRWNSDQYLAESPAERAAPIYDEMQKSAEKNPDQVVICGVEGPKSVYTTNAVCNAVTRFDKDYFEKLKPYTGYSVLQHCASTSSSACLAIIQELRSLAPVSSQTSRMTLIGKCATSLEKRLPGNEKPQYLNTCQDLVGYFR